MSCVGVSQQQLTAKRKKKFTGGNASKRHRDRVNVEFNNLARLLPYPEAMISKLDKSSILRLAVSYIRAKSFFKDNVSLEGAEESVAAPSSAKKIKLELPVTNPVTPDAGNSMAEIFLQALEGFLLVITEDMKVLYVSESVRDYLGYCQAGIIHESILNFVHGSDEGIIRHALQFLETNPRKSSSATPSPDARQACSDQEDDRVTSASSSSDSSSTCGLDDAQDPSFVQSRKFMCRMKCAFSCSSRFFTAFNSFQFSGHLRKSYVQDGKVKKSLNTLIVFCSPHDGHKYNNLDDIEAGLPQAIGDDRAQWSGSDEESHDGLKPRLTGLPIEPKFRLHVAPIVMSSRDLEQCSAPKQRGGGTGVAASSSVGKARRHTVTKAPPAHAQHVDDPNEQHHRSISSARPWYRTEPPAPDPVDDTRYPYSHRLPRARSSDCIYPSAATSPRNGPPAPASRRMSDFPPEVFSSAKILLDLSQHCVARREYDIACTKNRAMPTPYHVVKSEPWADDGVRAHPNSRHRSPATSADDSMLETHNRIYHIPRDRTQQFPYANGAAPMCCVQCHPEPQHSPASHRSSPATEHAGPKRAFNISSILGLDENCNGTTRPPHAARELRCPNGNILHFPKKKDTRQGRDATNEDGSMDDMKSSFADILQGMATSIADRFNSAITKAIEKTNDRKNASPEHP